MKKVGIHYWASVVIEIVGIIIGGAGLYEIAIMEAFNPAYFLITVSSMLIAAGALYHAKYRYIHYP